MCVKDVCFSSSTRKKMFVCPPTRGPVMNFCESEARGGDEADLGHWLLSTRSHVYLAVQPLAGMAVIQRGLYNVLRHGLRSSQSEKSSNGACPQRGTPLDQSEQCSMSASTHGHMARLRCPCERGKINTVVSNVAATQPRNGTPNPVL